MHSPILNGRSLGLCVVDTDQQTCEDEMEEAEGEVDAVDLVTQGRRISTSLHQSSLTRPSSGDRNLAALTANTP